MGAAHTPGPWTIWPADSVRGAQQAPLILAGATLVTVVHLNSVPDRTRANAHLIAAAPDLLDALKVARETIHTWHGDVAWDLYQASPEMQLIEAAIAKAEGR